MNRRIYTSFLIASVCLSNLSSSAQDVLIYSNQFLTPLTTPSIATWCQLDFSPDPVNSLWAGTGLGTSSGEFINTNTVETILITGPADIYDDPSGIGGDFSVGMLNAAFGDKLGLLIDTEGLPYLNVAMDISAINTTCGGPLAMDTVEFLIQVLDAPGGVFDLSNSAALDADTLMGTGPNEDSFIFEWAHDEGSLDVSGSTDGTVALRITLIRSNYASFDNIYIESSEDEVITAIEKTELSSVQVYPNPCTNQLSIQGLSNQVQTATIRSVLGEEMGSFSMNANGTIDVSMLPKGIYFVQLTQGVLAHTLRFVKE